MIRITTNGVLRSYKTGLTRSSNNLNKARNHVLSQRNFTSFAEDPSGAVQAFQLRRAFARTSDQYNTNNALTSKYEAAWTSISNILDTVAVSEEDNTAIRDAMVAGNDPTGSARQALSQALRQKAESIVQSLNVKYGDSFIFAGTDGLNVPFELKEGKLLYRGIDVDTKDPDELAKLKALAEETSFADIGLGFQEAGGKFVTASGFNSAISGVDILGYGTDEDGLPNNSVSIILKMADILENVDDSTNDLGPARDEYDALFTKLNSAKDALIKKHTELDGRADFLNTNALRLKSYAYTLDEQRLEIEQVDMADAITEFSWAQYCYNSALKVGNSILSQSLMDYMN